VNATDNINPTVYIVDDDQAIRHAMELLMKSIGQPCQLFASGDTFLEAYSADWSGCLILDIRMPGIGGLELQSELQKRNCNLPVIFITGFGDVPMAVEAIKQGAFDFIEKPFRDQELLDRIKAAIETDSRQRIAQSEASIVKERLQRLTGREREVMDLVVTGKANKVIAHELGVSQRTVEIHRARVMEKMEAKSLPELVRMHLIN